MYKRTETRPIFVGGIQIGGQNKVVIQSMCNTKTKDVEKVKNMMEKIVLKLLKDKNGLNMNKLILGLKHQLLIEDNNCITSEQCLNLGKEIYKFLSLLTIKLSSLEIQIF